MKKYSLLFCYLLFSLSSSLLAQDENLDIFEDDPAQVMQADEHGIFFLPIEKSTHSGFSIAKKDAGISISVGWNHSNGFAQWTVDVPSAGEYVVELQWGMPHESECTLAISANGNNVLQKSVDGTGTWIGNSYWHRNSKVMGKVLLPKGKVEIKATTPANKIGLDVASLRLIPAEGYEEKIKALRSGSRLGLSSYELELLYGPGMSGSNPSNIARDNSPGDTDLMLYKSIAGKVKTLSWAITDMKITGFFYMDKCICMDFDMWHDNSRGAAWTIAKTMVPNVEFNTTNIPANGKFTAYSKDKRYKFQYWENWFEIKDSALVRQLRIKDMESLKALDSIPRLGMTEENLQKIWGAGKPANNYKIVRPKMDGNNKDMDWELPASLRPYVTARKWTIPGARSMSITAAFWKNKCVWIDVNYDNRHGNKSAISPENCEELVKYFLPGVRFGAFRGNPKTELMEYSTRPARAYKLRKWHRNDFHYVEIFDMNSIRSLIAQDIAAQKKDASSLTKAIYSLPNAENAPLFGANRSDIKRMLGEPVECSFEIPNKHDVYGIPGCNMKLLILFDNNVCKEINIVYDGGVLAADAGLQVAQALLGKTPLPKMTDQQKKSWFLVKSVDEKARYSIEWYLGENWGVLMKLKDSQVSPQKSEKVQSLLDSL